MKKLVASVMIGLAALVGMLTACQKVRSFPEFIPPPPSSAAQQPSDAEQEYYARAQKMLVQYYTAAQGFRHFNDNLYSDLLITRYYIYDPKTQAKGIISVIEGIISGFERNENDRNRLSYTVNSFPDAETANAAITFIESITPLPDIDYAGAPRMEGIIAYAENLWGGLRPSIPVGLVGGVLKMSPAPLRTPFTIAQNILALPADTNEFIGYDSKTGQLRHVTRRHVELVPGMQTLTFVQRGTAHEETLPVVGAAVLEHLIADTQAPENSAILKEIRANQLFPPDTTPFTPSQGATTY